MAPVTRVAAIQLEPVIADVEANLATCERLADEAAAAGAEWILLPEFFTTGVGFVPALADAAVAPDGAATTLLEELARRHGATVGGSFLCRDPDGHARNAFFLATPHGIAGRHDKDLPTMWENCFYVGGSDDGVIETGGGTAGVSLCWEFMRAQTARRLRGKVDVVVGGSCWWSIPAWPPAALTRRMERANARTAAAIAPAFARLVGAPVVHAAHCGPLECAMPGAPFEYRGHLQGGAVISDAHGRVLARREAGEGPGVAIADVEIGAVAPDDELPDRYWLHRRGAMAAYTWNFQRWHGRHWYARHGAGRPPLRVEAVAGQPKSAV
jgi:predicted amidohydrolase